MYVRRLQKRFSEALYISPTKTADHTLRGVGQWDWQVCRTRYDHQHSEWHPNPLKQCGVWENCKSPPGQANSNTIPTHHSIDRVYYTHRTSYIACSSTAIAWHTRTLDMGIRCHFIGCSPLFLSGYWIWEQSAGDKLCVCSYICRGWYHCVNCTAKSPLLFLVSISNY